MAKAGMKYQTWMVLLATALVISCHRPGEDSGEVLPPPPISFDLDSILARGKMVLLTENSATSYYLYRNQAKGFDYEMAKAFAKQLGVKLEVKLLDDVDRMFEMLNSGQGDLIATNLTATAWRKKHFAMSTPLLETRQVLVQRKFSETDSLGALIRDTTALCGKTIWVHRYSSFYARLKQLQNSMGQCFTIHEAPGELSTDDLIRLCATGEIEYTVTDENLASIQAGDYPDLDMAFALTGDEDIAWALRQNSPQLLDTLNKWLASAATVKVLAKTEKKYFSIEERINYQSVFVLPNISGTQISRYDSLFRKYAKEIGWDWRLLAAVSYQESRFNPEARSWSGAFGLMQLMPETAVKFGCDSAQTEEANIRASVKYFKYLERMWTERIPDKAERICFILASYNIGPGHVMDAQCIATATGKKENVWSGEVAECMLLKTQEKYYSMECVKHGYCHGKEPYHFVSKILSVYDYYRRSGIPE